MKKIISILLEFVSNKKKFLKESYHYKVTTPRYVAKIFFFLVIMLSLSSGVYAQNLTDNVSFELRDQTLDKGLQKLGKLSRFEISYSADQVSQYKNISVEKKKRTVEATLKLLLVNTSLTYEVTRNNILIVKNNREVSTDSSLTSHILISGVITDIENNLLSDVSVRVKGTHIGTVSDRKGVYKIEADKDDVLIFSFLGLKKLEEHIRNNDVINVVLEDAHNQLNQVVVTGYSTKKVSEVTGSVIQLTGDELLSGVPETTDIYTMLQGKIPGVLKTRESGLDVEYIRGSSKMVSGSTSIGPTTPLIVLDGAVMGNVDINTLINPQDIQTISVLKDAASTAIYGSRAALGVIVIATKKGKTGLKFSLNNRSGINTYPNRMKYMTTSEWIDHNTKSLSGYWDGSTSAQAAYPNKSDYLKAMRTYSDEEAAQNYDWDKALHGTGYYNDFNLSFSSGSEKAQLYGSVGWYKEKGADLGSKTDRKTFKMNADFKLTPKLTTSFSASAILSQNISLNGNLDAGDYLPFLTPKDRNGNYNKTLNYRSLNSYVTGGVTYAAIPNVLYEANAFDNTYIATGETYLGSFVLKYKPIPYVSLQSANTIRHYLTKTNSYYDANSYSGRLGLYSNTFALAATYASYNANGTLDISNGTTDMFMTSNTASYRRQFGQHEISAFVGQEFSKTTGDKNSISYYNVLSGERNAGAATSVGSYLNYINGTAYTPSGSQSESAMFSVFGEASYRYNQRYVATASVRTDASPSFGKNNRYGTFYSLSGAWQIDQENFMKLLKSAVNNLKLRYAYGTSGRDLGGYYLNESYYSNTSSYNGVLKSGSIINQLANNNIKWETTYNHSLGVDFGLLNRVNATIDLYHKCSSGLVQATTLPATQGAYTQNINIGEVVNKGLEISINGDIVKTKSFSWNIGGNISFNKNKITKVSTGLRTFYLSAGQSIGDIKAILYKGVDSQTGAPLFQLGDGTISQGLTSKQASDTLNLVTIGNTNPKYYGGFQSTWRYHRFTLSTDWYYAVGHLVNNASIYTSIMPSTGSNSYKIPSSWHIWSGVGDTKANMPNIYSYNTWYFYYSKNSVFYQKGDFLRLRNVRLSYNFDRALVAKVGFKGASIYGNVDNVFIIKKKSNWKDAESTDNPLRIVLGVNVDF